MDLIVKDELVKYLDGLWNLIVECHTDYTNGVEGSNVNDDVMIGALFAIITMINNVPTHEGMMVTDKETRRLVEGIIRLKEGGAGNDT